MSNVEMVAVEPVNRYKPGDRFHVTEREAEQLEGKGLAKMIAPPKNKMAAEPENKANPSPAAGEASPSSASRAARVSPKPTARKSGVGSRKRPAAK